MPEIVNKQTRINELKRELAFAQHKVNALTREIEKETANLQKLVDGEFPVPSLKGRSLL